MTNKPANASLPVIGEKEIILDVQSIIFNRTEWGWVEIGDSLRVGLTKKGARRFLPIVSKIVAEKEREHDTEVESLATEIGNLRDDLEKRDKEIVSLKEQLKQARQDTAREIGQRLVDIGICENIEEFNSNIGEV